MLDWSKPLIPHTRPWITQEDVEAVSKTLQSRFIGKWKKTEELERVISGITFAPTVCVGSGRTALVQAMKLLGSKRVYIPTYSSDDLLDACLWAGCTPVPYDIGATIFRDTLVKVHQEIEPTDYFDNVKIIHDFAHFWPKMFKLHKETEMAVFSFGHAKPITGGTGGAISGHATFDRHKLWCNSPMNDISASLVLSQLNRPKRTKRLIIIDGGLDECENYFISRRITVRHETGGLVHRMMGLPDKDFPKAVERWNTVVSLPNHPDLTDEEKQRIDDACRDYSV